MRVIQTVGNSAKPLVYFPVEAHQSWLYVHVVAWIQICDKHGTWIKTYYIQMEDNDTAEQLKVLTELYQLQENSKHNQE